MKKNFRILLIIGLLYSFTVINKNYFTELVDEKLQEYSKVYSPEKIYIHTDKSNYINNETIWFSTYLLNGVTHEASDKSWVIYAELLNSKDSIVSKKTLFTNDISVAGDFKIDKSWMPGNYYIKAYTNYMKNEDPEFYFRKEVQIFDFNNTENINIETVSKINDSTRNYFKQIRPQIGFYHALSIWKLI